MAQRFQMLLNLRKKHCNLVNIEQLYGLDMVEVLVKQYHVPKYLSETSYYIKSHVYATKRNPFEYFRLLL